MKLEYLGLVGYESTAQKCAFLFHTGQGFNHLLNNKVVIFGTGINSFIAKKFLEDKNIEVDYYIDNNTNLQGKQKEGKSICSPYDCFKNKREHIVIAVSNKYINEIRLQLRLYNIHNYSIFFLEKYHNFETEGILELNNIIIDSINQIMIEEKDINEVAPIMSNVAGGDTSKLGNINYLLYSLMWTNHIYKWIYKDVYGSNMQLDVLDIGPGYGLLSMVITRIVQNVNLNWVCFSPHYSEQEGDERHKEKLGFSDTNLNIINGVIESTDFVFTKKYDIIILTEVFEHFVANPLPTLRKIADALKINGKIYFSTPNWGHLHLYESWKDMRTFDEFENINEYYGLYAGHTYQYTKEELFNIFDLCGLSVERYDISDGKNHNCVLVKNKTISPVL